MAEVIFSQEEPEGVDDAIRDFLYEYYDNEEELLQIERWILNLETISKRQAITLYQNLINYLELGEQQDLNLTVDEVSDRIDDLMNQVIQKKDESLQLLEDTQEEMDLDRLQDLTLEEDEMME